MAPSRGAGKPTKANGKAKSHKSSGNLEDPPTNAKDQVTGTLPVALQQKLLNIFRDAFPGTINSEYERKLQEVKSHLYNREFAQAFGKPENLAVYALRWSSSRALCYAGIFHEVLQLAQEEVAPTQITIACLGGGAGAEVVGLAGALRLLSDCPGTAESGDKAGEAHETLRLDVRAVDIADWANTVLALQETITTAPTISAYASAAAKAANCPLVEETIFTASFHQADLLELDNDRLRDLVGTSQLITLMFTLNELYSTSVPATQAFLEVLGSVAQLGTLLLVVDSPGSYSAVTLNGKEKQYPMHWLLDYTLLKQPSSNDDRHYDQTRWQKLRTEESTWFRLPESLKYPIQLENMRYQLHLYRRV